MKLKDIIDRSILKERGKIYSYITNYYSEINKDEPRTLSSSPEKDTIGKALENPDVWKLYMNHIRDCLKNDFYCDIAADILTQDIDMTCLDFPCAGNQRQQRRFADTVGADQTDHAAAGDIERHIVQRCYRTVSERDMVKSCGSRGTHVILPASRQARRRPDRF